MENHCVVVRFFLRESKVNKKGLSPIEVSISYSGERIYFSTGKFAKPSEWNKQKQMAKGNASEAQLLNAFLAEFRNKIYEKEIELMKRGYMVTVRLLRDAVLNKLESLKDKTLMQAVSEHNDAKKKVIGKGISSATCYCFEHSKKLLLKFMQKAYKREDVFLSEINMGFIQSFHTFLLTDKNMSQNTSSIERKCGKNNGFI